MAALVRHHDGTEIEFCDAPGQAGGIGFSEGRCRAFVLFDDDQASGSAILGPALRWAGKKAASELVVIASPSLAGVISRRTALLVMPGELDVCIHQIDGTSIIPTEPASRLVPPELGSDVWSLAGLISESGARAVDDHGRLVAEFAGLEVARVTRDADGRPLFEVGVGQADRELHTLVHSGMPPGRALARAVAAVAVHRHAGARPHPLNRVARERWLRSTLVDRPSLLGLVELEPVPPLEPRSTVLGNRPVAALGRTGDGEAVVVVCSTGVDLDLAPQAADYRDRVSSDARIVIVVPRVDRYPVTEELVAMVPRAELYSVDPPWDGPAASK